MKKIAYFVIAILGCQTLLAQNIDEQKMNRDLEVAKNILATLMKNETEMFWGGTGIEADYVQGYGVIFTLPRHFVYFNQVPPAIKPPDVKVIGKVPSYAIVIGNDEDEDNPDEQEELKGTEKSDSISEKKEIRININDERLKIMQEQKKMAEEQAKFAEKQAKFSEKQAHMLQDEMQNRMNDWQNNLKEGNEKMEKTMITFLADYADLISQLRPDDKIMIKQESPYEEFSIVGWGDNNDSESENAFNGQSMEVSKEDITAYKSGKISLDEFKNRINIKRDTPSRKVADLEMFANIFKQYYSPKLSQTYFTEGTPSYDVLENYGVIYKINTYSAYMEGDLYRMPALAGDKVNSEERKKTIESLYPKFVNDIKNFIIDYGRTIRSLSGNDILMLKIRLTRCEECSIPKSIDVSVKMSVLNQYDQQKITRDKALNAIEVKENNKEDNF